MFDIRKIVEVIVKLLVCAAIVGILFWMIHIVPIPEPYKYWIDVALKVLVGLAVIGILLDWAGYPIIKRDPPK